MRRLVPLAAALVALPGVAGAGDPAAGKAKSVQCQVCHGRDGIAVQPDAGNLAGQQETYLVNALQAYRSGARQHEQMSIIAQALSDEDIADLAAWYASFKVEVTMPE